MAAVMLDAKPPLPEPERRSGRDRRKKDLGLPAGWERRRGVEPRRPEVVELEFTPSQWDAVSDEAAPHGPTPPSTKG
jgi:hypothetical protein